MARKETISCERILETAFIMSKEEGFESVTARRVATKAGCSTQPIFRVYKNMEELWEAVYYKAVAYFEEFCDSFGRKSDVPFVNLGMAYISFAMTEPNLFRLLFVTEERKYKSMYELLNGSKGNVVKEIGQATKSGCKDASGLFMKMWICIHGAACMSLTKDYDLNENDTKAMLENSYEAFR